MHSIVSSASSAFNYRHLVCSSPFQISLAFRYTPTLFLSVQPISHFPPCFNASSIGRLFYLSCFLIWNVLTYNIIIIRIGTFLVLPFVIKICNNMLLQPWICFFFVHTHNSPLVLVIFVGTFFVRCISYFVALDFTKLAWCSPLFFPVFIDDPSCIS